MKNCPPGSFGLESVCFADTEGLTHAVVAPQWGANVIAFAFWDANLMWPLPLLESVDIAIVSMSPTSFGMPLLAPTPGRVGKNENGSFQYHGRSYRVKPSRHGMARHCQWKVERLDSSSIECTTEMRTEETGDDEFPYHLLGMHRITLTAKTLRSLVKLKNIGNGTMPTNVGWHPYLHRPNECMVSIPANSFWELTHDPEPTPTGKTIPVVQKNDFRRRRPLPIDERWDDIFTDLEGDNGLTVCSISEQRSLKTRSGSTVPIEIHRDVLFPSVKGPNGQLPIKNVQLFTPHNRQAISIEPLSCPPDAVNLLSRGLDRNQVIELTPGEEVSFEIVLRLRLNYL